MKMDWVEDHHIQLAKEVLGSMHYPELYVGSITSRKNCGACENLAIRRSQIGSMERRTFTFEQQSAQLDFIVQGNEFLI